MRSRWLVGPLGMALLAVGIETLVRTTGTPFYLTQLTMAAYYTLAALGLALLMGLAGQVSLAHAGFFALGGYVSAVLVTRDLSAYGTHALVGVLERLHLVNARLDSFGGAMLCVRPWPALFAALAITAVVAALIGVPVLRLRGHYLAMATLGAGSIVYLLVLGTRLFGEADGISDVPPLPLLAGLELGGSRSLRVLNYYVAWGLVILTLLAFARLMRSRAGRALRAIHDNEEAAAAMGVDTAAAKLKAFVGVGRAGRRPAHALQRRHRALGSERDEVDPVCGHRGGRGHEPLHRRGAGEPHAQLSFAAGVLRDL